MLRITMAGLLASASCTSSPHYHRSYTPTRGTTAIPQQDAVQRATIAITDAGLSVETTTGGVVVTAWDQRGGFGGSDRRYRLRVNVESTGRYEIAILCEGKDPMGGAWEAEECPADARPQYMLDAQAKVAAALPAGDPAPQVVTPDAAPATLDAPASAPIDAQ